MSRPADWHLLFGLLALQNGLINREQLVAAFSGWANDKSVGIDTLLVQQGAITQDRCAILTQLVEIHIQGNGDAPQESLRTLVGSDLAVVRAELHAIEDEDLVKSVALLPDDHATMPVQIGNPTSEGSRFRILRPLEGGSGGMGVISVAEDGELGRHVALKQIRSDQADSPEFRNRFQVEAEITGNLEHPGIVPIYGLGSDSTGRPYYAMRLVKGDNLGHAITSFHDALAKGNADFESVQFRNLVDRLIDVGQAIDYAHSRGVLHRDLKPGNVLVGNFGETLVIDWGLARLPTRGSGSTEAEHEQVDALAQSLLKIRSGDQIEGTAHGAILGTLGYAAPEQLEGEIDKVGVPSDVYGLGSMLYHILANQPPVDTANRDVRDIMDDVLRGKITPPRKLDRRIPKSLSAICLKAISFRPKDRYESAREFVEELERWKADQPISAKRETLFDRAGRFLRRHRSASLVSLLSAAAIAIICAIALHYVNQERLRAQSAKEEADQYAKLEKSARQKAESAEKEAKRSAAAAQLAEAEATRGAYRYAIAAAKTAWENGEYENAKDLLSSCQWDLRGWEHDYLRDRLNSGFVATLEGISYRNQPLYFEASRQNERIVGAYENGLIRVWDTTSGRRIRDIKGHKSEILDVAISPDGQRIVSGSKDGTVRVWSVNDGIELNCMKTISAQPHRLQISIEQKRFAEYHKDRWHINSYGRGIESEVIIPGNDTITLAFVVDSGRDVLTLDATGKVRTYSDGLELRTQELEDFKGCHYPSFSDDGSFLVGVEWDAAGTSSYVSAWSTVTGVRLWGLRIDVNRPIKIFDNLVYILEPSGLGGNRIVTLSLETGEIANISNLGDSFNLMLDNKRTLNFRDGFSRSIDIRHLSGNGNANTVLGKDQYFHSIAINYDGSRIFGGKNFGEVAFFDLNDRSLDAKWVAYKSARSRNKPENVVVAINSAGDLVATGIHSRPSVHIWSKHAKGFKLCKTFIHTVDDSARFTGVKQVEFSPDGKRFLSIGFDSRLRVWDLTAPTGIGGEIKKSIWQKPKVQHASFSPNGESILCGRNEKMVEVLQASNGESKWKEEHSLELVNSSYTAFRVAYNSLGQEVLTTVGGHPSEDSKLSSVIIRDHGSGAVLSVIQSFDGERFTKAEFLGEQRVVTSGSRGRVVIWRWPHGKPTLVLQDGPDKVFDLDVSTDQTTIASSSRKRKGITVWRPSKLQKPLDQTGHYGGVVNLAVSRSGGWFASSGVEGSIKFWNMRTGHPSSSISGKFTWPQLLAVSSTGKIASYVRRQGRDEICTWNAKDGSFIRAFDPRRASHSREKILSISDDGRWLASCSSDFSHPGIVWDTHNETENAAHFLTTNGRYVDKIQAIEFSPDGKWILYGDSDGWLYFYDIEKSKLDAPIKTHPITSIAISNDGSKIATGGNDGVVQIRRFDGEIIRPTIDTAAGPIQQLQFNHDGSVIAVAGNQCGVFSVESGDELFAFWDAPVSSVAIVKDYLVIGSSRKTRNLFVSRPKFLRNEPSSQVPK